MELLEALGDALCELSDEHKREAIECYESALIKCRENNMPDRLSPLYTSLALTCSEINRFDQAIHATHQLIDTVRKGSPQHAEALGDLAKYTIDLARSSSESKRPTELHRAIGYLDEAKTIIKQCSVQQAKHKLKRKGSIINDDDDDGDEDIDANRALLQTHINIEVGLEPDYFHAIQLIATS